MKKQKQISKKDYNKGFWIMVLSIFCFSFVEIAGILVFQKGGTPLTLLTGRAMFAVGVFAVFILLYKQKFKIDKKDIWLFVLSGLFLAGMLISFYNGLKTLGHVGVHLSLFFLHPIFMAFLAIPLFKEKLTKTKVFSLILGFIGVLFVLKILPGFSVANFEFSIWGVMYSILSGLLLGGFMFCSQKLLKKYHFTQTLFYSYLIALVVFLICQNPTFSAQQLMIPYIFKAVLIVGIVATCFAYSLQQVGVKKLGAATASSIKPIKPIIGGILAFLVLGQVMNFFQILGGLIILASAYLIRRRK